MTGVVIITTGKRSYGEMAFNLAVSLKTFSDIPIAVISDGCIQKVRDWNLWVDQIIQAPGGMNPFEIKVNLWNLSPFEKTLYIDADSLYIGNDPNAFIKSIEKKSFLIGEYKRWPKDGKPIQYSWAKLPDIWKAYGLNESALYPECNSSLLWFDRSKKNEKLFEKVRECYGQKIKLNATAGGFFPDEVAWGAGMALTKRYSNIEGWMPCYFNWHAGKKPRDYEWISMAGRNHPSKLLNAYNSTIAQNANNHGVLRYRFTPKMKKYGFI